MDERLRLEGDRQPAVVVLLLAVSRFDAINAGGETIAIPPT